MGPKRFGRGVDARHDRDAEPCSRVDDRLAPGENLLCFRAPGLEAGRAESISIECVELDVE